MTPSKRRGVRALDGDIMLGEAMRLIICGLSAAKARMIAAELAAEFWLKRGKIKPDTRAHFVKSALRWLQVNMRGQNLGEFNKIERRVDSFLEAAVAKMMRSMRMSGVNAHQLRNLAVYWYPPSSPNK